MEMEGEPGDVRARDAGLRAWLALAALAGPRLAARVMMQEIREAGSPEAWLGRTRRADRVDWGEVDRMERAVREEGMETVPFLSPWYPPAFEELAAPPAVLFLTGRVELLGRPAVGVVGTRAATAAALDAARRLGRGLAEAGWTVVSGLARGVDAAAHEGALEAGGDTIGVLGCGVDVPYPKRNRELRAEIAGRGLLVSEFPPGTPPRRMNFPQRNRLVSALARAVVVVEAGAKSGALITAADARRLGRALFAYPGAAGEPENAGGNGLLKRGEARLVESAADVLDALAGIAAPDEAPAEGPVEDEVRGDEPPLLRRLGGSPVSADLLARQLGRPVAVVLAELMELELAGRVESVRGGTAWRRRRGRRT
jgi:DNA processing protein